MSRLLLVVALMFGVLAVTMGASASSPSVVQSGQADAGPASLNVSWAAPSNTGGGVTDYMVYKSTSPNYLQYVANVNGVNTSFQLNGLTNYGRYYVGVQAMSTCVANSTCATDTVNADRGNATQLRLLGGEVAVWQLDAKDASGATSNCGNTIACLSVESSRLYTDRDCTSTGVNTGAPSGGKFWGGWNVVTTGSGGAGLSCSNSAALDPNTLGKFTVMAWVNPSDHTATARGIMARYTNAPDNGFALEYGSAGAGKVRFTIMVSGTSTTADTADLLPAGAWHHVAATYDNSNGAMTVYVDGVSQATATVSGTKTPVNQPNSFLIGNGPGSQLSGNVDEVRVFSGVLTAAQITDIMNNPYAPASMGTEVPAPSAPNAPTGLTLTPSSNSVALAWTAPSLSGGSAVTQYHVYRNVAGKSAPSIVNMVNFSATNGNNVSYTDATALNGVTYAYAVTAENAYNESYLSSIATVTPQATNTLCSTPGAPTSLTAGTGALTASWAAVAACSLTKYNVYAGTTSSDLYFVGTTGGTNTTFVVSNLVGGPTNYNGQAQTYYVGVSAVNAAGETPIGATTSAAPNTIPGSPTGIVAIPLNGAVNLSWLAPAYTGGVAITNYNVYQCTATPCSTLLASTGGSNTTFKVNGLTNGVKYFFNIGSVNGVAGGVNKASAEVIQYPTSSAAPAVPSRVNNLTVGRGNSQLYVNWASNNDTNVFGYLVYRSTTASFTPSVGTQVGNVSWTSTSWTDPSPGAGVVYYRVLAYNTLFVNGTASYAFGSSVCTGCGTAPTAPVLLNARGGSTWVQLSWQAPTWDGWHRVTQYKIYRNDTSVQSSNGFAPWSWVQYKTLDGSQFVFNDSAVNVGNYSYKITAVNDRGESGWSPVNASTANVPNAPQSVSATIDGGNVARVTWAAPSFDGGRGLLNYRVYAAGVLIATVPANMFAFNDSRTWATTDTSAVTYGVSAVNQQGEGATAAASSVTPLRRDLPILDAWQNTTALLNSGGVTPPANATVDAIRNTFTNAEVTGNGLGNGEYILGSALGSANVATPTSVDYAVDVVATTKGSTPSNIQCGATTSVFDVGQGITGNGAPEFCIRARTTGTAADRADVTLSLVWANGPVGNFSSIAPATEWVYGNITFWQLRPGQYYWGTLTAGNFSYLKCATIACGAGSVTTANWMWNTAAANTTGTATNALPFAGTWRLVAQADFETGANTSVVWVHSDWDQGNTTSYAASLAGIIQTRMNLTYDRAMHNDGCTAPDSRIVRSGGSCVMFQTNGAAWKLTPSVHTGQPMGSWAALANALPTDNAGNNTWGAGGQSGGLVRPTVATDGTDKRVFVWNESGNIYGRMYDANMVLVADRVLLLNSNVGSVITARMVTTSDGKWWFVYKTHAASNVFVQQYSATLTATGSLLDTGTPCGTCGEDQTSHSVLDFIGGDTHILFYWLNQTAGCSGSSGTCVSAKSFNPSGCTTPCAPGTFSAVVAPMGSTTRALGQVYCASAYGPSAITATGGGWLLACVIGDAAAARGDIMENVITEAGALQLTSAVIVMQQTGTENYNRPPSVAYDGQFTPTGTSTTGGGGSTFATKTHFLIAAATQPSASGVVTIRAVSVDPTTTTGSNAGTSHVSSTVSGLVSGDIVFTGLVPYRGMFLVTEANSNQMDGVNRWVNSTYRFGIMDNQGIMLHPLTTFASGTNMTSRWFRTDTGTQANQMAAYVWAIPSLNIGYVAWYGRNAANTTDAWNYTLITPLESLQATQYAPGLQTVVGYAIVPVDSTTKFYNITTPPGLTRQYYLDNLSFVQNLMNTSVWWSSWNTSVALTEGGRGQNGTYRAEVLRPDNPNGFSYSVSASVFVDDTLVPTVSDSKMMASFGNASIYKLLRTDSLFRANGTLNDRWGNPVTEQNANVFLEDASYDSAGMILGTNVTGFTSFALMTAGAGATNSYTSTMPMNTGEVLDYALRYQLTTNLNPPASATSVSGTGTIASVADVSDTAFKWMEWVDAHEAQSPYSDVVNGDVERFNATITNANGLPVPDATSVTLRVYAANGALTYTSSQTTTGGQTGNFDQTLADSDVAGTWNMTTLISGAESVVDARNETFNLSRNLIIDTLTLNPQWSTDAFKVYNRGEVIETTGCVQHADGGAFRYRRPAAADLPRTATLQYYNGTTSSLYGTSAQETTLSTTGAWNCAFDVLTTVATTASDTYYSAAPRVSDGDGLDYSARVYAQNGTVSSNAVGIDANLANVLDISNQWFVSTSTLQWLTVMRDDRDRTTATLQDARGVAVPDGSYAWVEYLTPASASAVYVQGGQITTGGVTLNLDVTFDEAAPTGTWTVQVNATANATNKQNSVYALITKTFTLSSALTFTNTAFQVAGQSTAAYFNLGEVAQYTGFVLHADGKELRRLMADGTNQSRSVSVSYYRHNTTATDTSAWGGGTASVDATTGFFALNVTVPTSVPDTYNSSVGGNSLKEYLDWDALTYDYTGWTTSNYQGNYGNQSNVLDVDANYYHQNNTLWSATVLMRGDTQRTDANFVGARNQSIPDGSTVQVKWYDGASALRQTTTTTTISGQTIETGVTGGVDWLIPMDAANGTGKVQFVINAGDAGNNQNNMAETTASAIGDTWPMSAVITAVWLDSNTTGTTDAFKAYNLGETVQITGLLKHADGGCYRVRNPNGTYARNETLQIYLNTYGQNSVQTTNNPVSLTCWVWGNVTLPTSSASMVDTFNSTTPRVADGDGGDYSIRAYDGGTTSSNTNGNDATIQRLLEVDGNYYLQSTSQRYATVMRDDWNEWTLGVEDAQATVVPSGTSVWFNLKDPTSVVWSSGARTTSGGYVAAPVDYNFPQNAPAGTWGMHINVTANATNNGNSMSDTLDASFVLSLSATINVGTPDVNVTGTAGQSNYFNRGETISFTGVLSHADGSAYRKLMWDGTVQPRNVSVEYYHNTRGESGSFVSPVQQVNSATGVVTVDPVGVMIPNAADDTYASVTSGVAETKDWNAYVYDGGTSTDNNGNSGTVNNLFDVSMAIFVDRYYEGRQNSDNTLTDLNSGTNDVTAQDQDYGRAYVKNVRGELTNQFDTLSVQRALQDPQTLSQVSTASLALTNSAAGGFYNNAWGSVALWSTYKTVYTMATADSHANTVLRADAAATTLTGKMHYLVTRVTPLRTHVLTTQVENVTVVTVDSYADWADDGVLDMSAGQVQDGSLAGLWADYLDASSSTTTFNQSFSSQSSPFNLSYAYQTGDALGYRDVYVQMQGIGGHLLGRGWLSAPQTYDQHARFATLSTAGTLKATWLTTNSTQWNMSGFVTLTDTSTLPNTLQVVGGSGTARWDSEVRDLGAAGAVTPKLSYNLPNTASPSAVYYWVNASDDNFATTKSSASGSFSVPAGQAASGTNVLLNAPSPTGRYAKVVLILTNAAQVSQLSVESPRVQPAALDDSIGAWLVDDLKVTNVTTDQNPYNLDLNSTVYATVTLAYVQTTGAPENQSYSVNTTLHVPTGGMAPVTLYALSNSFQNASTNETGLVRVGFPLTMQAQAGWGWTVQANATGGNSVAYFGVAPHFGAPQWQARKYSNVAFAWEGTTQFQRSEPVNVTIPLSNNLEAFTPNGVTITDDDGRGEVLNTTPTYDTTLKTLTATWSWNASATADYGTPHKPWFNFTLNGLTTGTQPSQPAFVFSNYTVGNIWHALTKQDTKESELFVIGANVMWTWADQYNIRNESYAHVANTTWLLTEPTSGLALAQNPVTSSDSPLVVSDHGTESTFSPQTPHMRTGWGSFNPGAPATVWSVTASMLDGAGNNASRGEFVSFISSSTPWTWKCAGQGFGYHVGQVANMSCFFMQVQPDGTDQPVSLQNPAFIQWFSKKNGDANVTNLTVRTVMGVTNFASTDSAAQAAYGSITDLAYSTFQVPVDLTYYINRGIAFRVDTLYNQIPIQFYGVLLVQATDPLYSLVPVNDLLLAPGVPASITVRSLLNQPGAGPVSFGVDSCGTSADSGPATCVGDQAGNPRIGIEALNESCNCWASYLNPNSPWNDGLVVGNFTEMPRDYRFPGYTYTFNWTPPGSLSGKDFYIVLAGNYYSTNITLYKQMNVKTLGGTDPLVVQAPPQKVVAGRPVGLRIDSKYVNATARTGAAASLFVTVADAFTDTPYVTNANPVEVASGGYRYNFTPPTPGDYAVWVTTLAADGNVEEASTTFHADVDQLLNLTRIETTVNNTAASSGTGNQNLSAMLTMLSAQVNAAGANANATASYTNWLLNATGNSTYNGTLLVQNYLALLSNASVVQQLGFESYLSDRINQTNGSTQAALLNVQSTLYNGQNASTSTIVTAVLLAQNYLAGNNNATASYTNWLLNATGNSTYNGTLLVQNYLASLSNTSSSGAASFQSYLSDRINQTNGSTQALLLGVQSYVAGNTNVSVLTVVNAVLAAQNYLAMNANATAAQQRVDLLAVQNYLATTSNASFAGAASFQSYLSDRINQTNGGTQALLLSVQSYLAGGTNASASALVAALLAEQAYLANGVNASANNTMNMTLATQNYLATMSNGTAAQLVGFDSYLSDRINQTNGSGQALLLNVQSTLYGGVNSTSNATANTVTVALMLAQSYLASVTNLTSQTTQSVALGIESYLAANTNASVAGVSAFIDGELNRTSAMVLQNVTNVYAFEQYLSSQLNLTNASDALVTLAAMDYIARDVNASSSVMQALTNASSITMQALTNTTAAATQALTNATTQSLISLSVSEYTNQYALTQAVQAYLDGRISGLNGTLQGNLSAGFAYAATLTNTTEQAQVMLILAAMDYESRALNSTNASLSTQIESLNTNVTGQNAGVYSGVNATLTSASFNSFVTSFLVKFHDHANITNSTTSGVNFLATSIIPQLRSGQSSDLLHEMMQLNNTVSQATQRQNEGITGTLVQQAVTLDILKYGIIFAIGGTIMLAYRLVKRVRPKSNVARILGIGARPVDAFLAYEKSNLEALQSKPSLQRVQRKRRRPEP